MPEASARPSTIECDLCIIGAGSAGLTAAAGAAQLGAKVVLIERGEMGGDCLNTGCVPSKSLIAAAHMAHSFTAGLEMGVGEGLAPRINFQAVHDHIHGVIGQIAPHDSVERFESLGVQVLKESAKFTGPDQVVAGPYTVKARRFVVATGSRAVVPPVPGLRELEPMTNETVFDLTELPEHLLIVGGGPIGLEMAQAFARLGSKVTVVDVATILPRDEPEAAELARKKLGDERIVLYENAKLIDPKRTADSVSATIEANGEDHQIAASHILVAAGRSANVNDIGLTAAGVEFTPKGITVDGRLRTSNRKIFAVGDVAGGPQFTHIAGYHAGIVIRNALFGLPAKVDYAALPWVTYLDPEVAHVGLVESEARKQHEDVQILVEHFDENDRAQTEKRVEGFIKLVLTKRGKVVGATVVGPHAGELIGIWGLVISGKLSLAAVAGMIAPYPTLAEISKRVAGSYYKPKLFSPLTQNFVKLIQRWLP
ncbi:FAD-dependent oxidoreductase [Devosia rhodophyticola]|uniref:FAD-dependent oxidoreductase n=1 Tax=Devosia rhodophyticola TaxID=3026423 RepID=A0ABY7YY40_9HYPH|nr:FAD-dependent oxidoreductase [Devosia rhodophyticola]WDR06303.1 FAD-dependent oxidoreductase [Devosia rhodophyticola]